MLCLSLENSYHPWDPRRKCDFECRILAIHSNFHGGAEAPTSSPPSKEGQEHGWTQNAGVQYSLSSKSLPVLKSSVSGITELCLLPLLWELLIAATFSCRGPASTWKEAYLSLWKAMMNMVGFWEEYPGSRLSWVQNGSLRPMVMRPAPWCRGPARGRGQTPNLQNGDFSPVVLCARDPWGTGEGGWLGIHSLKIPPSHWHPSTFIST